jgi:surface antigen
MAAAAVLSLGVTAASAQPNWVPPGNDPNGYYSQGDHNGYYDHNGDYQRIRQYQPPPPQPQAYYQQGQYEQNCQRGNQAAGTIFGALAGGLIGSAASHGNGGAVVGGAILGGLLGNTISRDIDCNDQSTAYSQFTVGLNGEVGRRYDWRHGNNYGYFTPTREYRRSGYVCRDFTETSDRRGQSFTRTGTACRQNDGNWRFD